MINFRLSIAAALLGTVPGPVYLVAQPPAGDSAIARARTAFDFLVGAWRVTSRSDGPGAAPADETMVFEKSLDGNLLSGRWRFNRGTPARPDFVDAAYLSAFDNRSRTWSFYYVSPQSAQYWPGELVNGGWRFLKTFATDSASLIQRQSWEPVDDTTMHRRIESSTDNGATWSTLLIELCRRGRSGR